MPRKPRFFLPDVPVHIVQRGHNREAVFFEDDDYRAYLGWLKAASAKYDCQIHAYCLMTNHIHLLVTPSTKTGVTLMMQYIGRFYVPYINHKYGKTGSIWEGRYKASLVDAEHYLLQCMRYIELNPVAADMVRVAGEYLWSSYRCNAEGKPDPLLTPHPVFTEFTVGGEERDAYKALFNVHQDEIEQDHKQIAAAVQTGTPLASGRFREQVELALGQKVGQARRGRPAGYKATKVPEGNGQRGFKGL